MISQVAAAAVVSAENYLRHVHSLDMEISGRKMSPVDMEISASNWKSQLQCFLRGWEWSDLDIFGVYICEGKKQQHKYNLGTHDPKTADTITNFHPTASILDLLKSKGAFLKEEPEQRLSFEPDTISSF